jgi:hypothetical protein
VSAKEIVDTARSMLTGSQMGDLTILSAAYTPGDTSISLQYPRPNLSQGTILSVGLNTFFVLSVDSGGSVITVQPNVDGGPNQAAAVGDTVLVKPAVTTWALFRELKNTIRSMSSPDVGLYAPASFQSTYNTFGVYTLPTAWDGIDPIRILSVRYKKSGTIDWERIDAYEWLADRGIVRIHSPQPGAQLFEFVFALPFSAPESLATTYEEMGIPGPFSDIPALGLASKMSLSMEGRRVQPLAQGDSRRAEEVGPGANIGLSREYGRIYRDRCNEELARLTRLYGYRLSGS